MTQSAAGLPEYAKRLELLSALKAYFEARALSISKALELRAQLSVEGLQQLRHGYSQYFVSLLSAIDILKDAGEKFEEKLISRLTSSSLSDGKQTLDYLRELRNAIVHRNLDISARADFLESIPILHLPTVSDRKGVKQLAPPRQYVLQLVSICEATIGPAVNEHLVETDMFRPVEEPNPIRFARLEDFLRSDPTIPAFVGQNIKKMAKHLDFAKADQDFFDSVRYQLRPLELSLPLSVQALL